MTTGRINQVTIVKDNKENSARDQGQTNRYSPHRSTNDRAQLIVIRSKDQIHKVLTPQWKKRTKYAHPGTPTEPPRLSKDNRKGFFGAGKSRQISPAWNPQKTSLLVSKVDAELRSCPLLLLMRIFLKIIKHTDPLKGHMRMHPKNRLLV